MDAPPVYIVLTTYNRTSLAIRTIDGIKENLIYPNYGWIICDDGSPPEHMEAVLAAVGTDHYVFTYNGERRGVGHNMNWALAKLRTMDVSLCLMNEGDWLLENPFDLSPYVNLLTNRTEIGMCRMGYLSAGLNANVISAEGKLWLKFVQQGAQYIYAGHASLRHLRLHDKVGMFAEGLAPGATELDFCGKYNATPHAPAITWCLDYGSFGPFAHIGSESLADVWPKNGG